MLGLGSALALAMVAKESQAVAINDNRPILSFLG
jgi:hypothetical protein